jgi:hypothetical protein
VQTTAIPLPQGIDHEVPRWSAVYSIYSEMRRLLPSTSPCPSSEAEGERTARVKEEEGSESVFADGDCVGMDCLEGSGMSASRGWGESSAPLDKRVGLEQGVAACDPRLLHRDFSLEEAHCGGGVGAGHDVFMNDLDALLRF